METLSALVDDELAAPARAEIQTHALTCPICGAALADLNALRARFAALPELRVGFDLAPAVGDRIRAAGRRHAVRPARERPRWWRTFPAALGAAAALSAGTYLGSLFAVGGGVVASRAAIEMSVFDAVPPGGICLGPTCGTGGR
jgi:anti-sigma factor RsiW